MIPVVVFAYRRPDLLAQTLAALRTEPVPLLIAFSDGPRDASDAPAVALLRQVLRAVGWCPARVVERPASLGLGRSARDGVRRALARSESPLFSAAGPRSPPERWPC